MKKIICLFLLAFIFMFTACRAQNSNSSEVNSGGAVGTGDSNTISGNTSEPQSDNGESGKILIAYFSWSGNTKQLAEMIQNETSGDLFTISPAVPYTDNYDDLLDIAQQEQRDNARPKVAETVSAMDSYDIVFIGYPNWWNDAPKLVLSFLESYDLSGKTVIPFCTHGSSGFGRSVDSVKNSAQGANFLDGFEVRGANVGKAQNDVSSWISGLNLK
ncbi:MAG: flavodoxin [Oscillospiraceae bacterium]|nr:flavodoxin [Oscillospiraceae bacterium]